MATPPQLTPEQRAAALVKAAEARAARAEIKARLKMGSMSLPEALDSEAFRVVQPFVGAADGEPGTPAQRRAGPLGLAGDLAVCGERARGDAGGAGRPGAGQSGDRDAGQAGERPRGRAAGAAHTPPAPVVRANSPNTCDLRCCVHPAPSVWPIPSPQLHINVPTPLLTCAHSAVLHIKRRRNPTNAPS